MDYNQNNYEVNETYSNDPYNYNPEPQKNSGMGIAALVVGICAFFINPLYICSLLAIIFGIIGVNVKDAKKDCAIAGIICGGCSFLVQVIGDILLTIFSFGFGGISFFC